MRLTVAIVLGFLSGFLIYMGSAMLFMDFDSASGPSSAFVAITFLGGWIGSSYFFYRGTKNVSRVFTRGALVGAAEWLLIGLAGIVMSGRAASSSLSQSGGSSGAEAAGAALGGGLMATVAGGVSIVMAVVCLIVFAIAYFAGRELADTTSTPTKRCPECAEMVQAEARKCKHCGATLTPSQAVA